MDTRDWRDAKIPQWVKEAVEAEMKADKLKLALAWPDETRPKPEFVLSYSLRFPPEAALGQAFYSRPHGWVKVGSNFKIVSLETYKEIESPWGEYFGTERDAMLNHLWDRCETVAKDLIYHRELFEAAKRDGR
jgi:hypothetical protein